MLDQVTKYEYKGKTYEQEHGNAFDRGSADSYYGRGRNPHKGGSGGKCRYMGGFNIGFGPRSHAGSRFVELSMLTGDGKVRR